jgi:menaquinone-dependent protoporphyrinogen oxidase
MRPIGILYATREGHTRKIAEFLAAHLRHHGVEVDLRDVAESAPRVDQYAAVVLAASVHLGKHEKEMVKLVRAQREALERIPTAFVSVSMSERGAEDPDNSPERQAQFSHDVQKVIDGFVAETGFHPGQVKPVAGALMYTKYNPLIRFVLKRISKKEGGSTDTSRNHDYTDWAALERFAAELAQSFAAPSQEAH